jgi:hypothetical protein
MSLPTNTALSFNSQTSKLSVDGKPIATTNYVDEKIAAKKFVIDDITDNTLTNKKFVGNIGNNTVFGSGSLISITSGIGNAAIGNGALSNNTDGNNNAATGTNALYNTTSGDFNVANGFAAGGNNKNSNNTFLGASSDVNTLITNYERFSNSTALGYNSKITASNQIVLGTSTETVRIPKFTTAGIVRNTASGDLSASGLIVAADISNNTLTNDKFVGNNNNTNSTAFGNGSLLKSRAHNNTAIGCIALENNTTGNNNTAVGFTVLNKNTTGGNNTAVGFKALELNTTGENNTAHGFIALNENTTGSNNTAHGFLALQKNTTGINNSAHGFLALQLNTTGINNSAHGFLALQNNTTGEKNTSIGNEAGINNKTNNNNTFLGANSDLINNTNTWSNSTAIGYNSKITDSNQIVLGTSGETVRIPKFTTAGVVRNNASGNLSATGLIVAADISDATITNAKLASGIDKSKVGLGNVTNTSDADKPVSTAQQTALDAKANKSELNIMPTTQPVGPVTGAFWFDISTGYLNIYNGEGWVSFSPVT